MDLGRAESNDQLLMVLIIVGSALLVVGIVLVLLCRRIPCKLITPCKRKTTDAGSSFAGGTISFPACMASPPRSSTWAQSLTVVTVEYDNVIVSGLCPGPADLGGGQTSSAYGLELEQKLSTASEVLSTTGDADGMRDCGGVRTRHEHS